MKSKLLLVIVTAIMLLAFPKVNNGQVINLGSDASKFVLFTSSGAVGDNASAHSHITGDVGTLTPGPITGFGNIDGLMHPGTDPAAAACEIDLQATIAQINSNPATLVGPLSLGSGAVLIPGIYSIPGNATLTLDLILDGQGDPNAEFVLKIAGTFATNTNSKVKLINGALACHVFWKIDGAVTMASLSTMRGNIISGGAITMGSGDSLEGRAFTTVGLIGIDGITAYTPIGCGSPVLTGPLAPDLATAACYTIFTSNGALDGSASSTAIGDVGSNGGGSVTGWTAGNVTGTLHITQDPSTIQCAIDVSNLYNTLNAMVPDIELLYPVEFGNDLVLTPHVYLLNSGGAFGPATFTNSIYLDAQGNPNAVFVIKVIGGALTTSTYAKVNLINGAQAKNVFWMVDGAVSINNYSEFAGTIVVSVGAVNLVNTGVILDGRILTMNGLVTTAGLAASMPPGCGSVAPPVITTEPTNQTACNGGSVNFTVTATATGADLTYQWRKGNVNLVDVGNISGATTATLTINPAGIADVGNNYNVIVSGSVAPNDTSINVSLALNASTVITLEPTNQTACIGGSVNFSVIASGTGLSYQWRKGNVNLIDGLNINGATNDTLTIDPISLSDTSSFYNVIVTGDCSGDTSINVSLMLNVAPVITMEPINQTVCIGSAVNFSVIASGTGLSYQWRKGNVNLIDGLNIDGATNDTLTIDPTSLSDTSSFYNVIVFDGCGLSDTSVFISLMFNAAPVITMEPINQTVCVGSAVDFSVSATGNGLTYQWRKGTVNLIDGLNINGATNDTLTIDPTSLSDTSSFYNVIVFDGCGLSDTSIFVTLTITQLPVALASSNSPVCTGSQIELIAQPVVGATYSWTGVNAFSSLVQNPVIASAALLDAGIYTLTVIANGCSSLPSDVNVVVNNCFVNLSVVKTVDNAQPLIGRNVVFTIVVTNNGPSNATGVVVTDLLQSGYTFISSTTTVGMYNSTTGIWNIDTMVNGASEVLTITALVNATGIYTNTASITGNEIDIDVVDNVSTIETFPTDFNIPEGFSPNADGINDLFVIRGILYYPNNTIVIYNRWGDKVFEASPYQNTWDGKTSMGLQVGGDKLPVGTYFYILDLGDSSDVIKGTIYLNW